MNTISRSRGAVLLLLLILSTAPAFAQAPAFLIEKIEVRNLRRASPQVVRSESLLHEGQTYTERQLQDAQSRIRRLPFVLDVDFSLEKGSERDRYVLVMKVDEASPFFVGIDHVTYPPDDGRGTVNHTTVDLGFRWFVGEYGQLHASLGGEIDDQPRGLFLGYTQYNLLGRSIFLSLTGSTELLENIDSLGFNGVLGVPLRGNHALRLAYSGFRSENEHGEDFDSSGSSVSLGWLYDTSNDALFPTEGVKLGAGVAHSRHEMTASAIQWPDGVLLDARETVSTGTGLQLNATKYWPLRELDAISIDGQLTRSRNEQDTVFVPDVPNFVAMKSTVLQAAAEVKYSGSLWGLEKTRRIGDLRYEAGLRGWRYHNDLSGVGLPDATYSEVGLVAGLAHRNRWGLIRVSAAWTLSSSSDR